MKKIFTYLAAFLFCGTLSAQISPIKAKNGDVSSKAPLYNIGGNEVLSNLITNPNPNTAALKSTNTINDLEIIYQNVDKNIKSKIYYAPKKKMINFFSKKLNKILKKKQILPTSKLDINIKKSKLVICTYPQTTFFDAIMSGHS